MKISLFFCLEVALILAACIVILLVQYEKLNRQHKSLRDSYFQLEKLHCELRAQRHDYLNHLQVVYGLMELEEYRELHNYLEPVFKDMMKTGKALKTSRPAINALLKAKMDEAEGQNIDFYIEVKSDLKFLKAEDWEICRVLANLIDNGIGALNDREGEKLIRVEIMEDRQNYIFSVANNGPKIPEHLREEIFKQGFTTKKEDGHGMGLFIVANVLKTHKGSLELVSEEETIFTFRLPKEERR